MEVQIIVVIWVVIKCLQVISSVISSLSLLEMSSRTTVCDCHMMITDENIASLGNKLHAIHSGMPKVFKLP